MAERSYGAGRFALGVDGEFAGFIKKVSGGIIKGEVATHNLATSNFQKKHLATISYEPLTLEMSLGMGQNMWEWIKASWDKGFVQKNVTVEACDFNHKVQAVREFSDCYIKEVTLPAWDGSSKDAAYMTLVLEPRIIRYVKGDQSEIKGDENLNSKKWLCSNFRFELGSLPCDRVSKIDSLKWEQKVVRDDVGAFRDSMKEPAALVIPNIKLTISMADIDPWADWHKSFVIDGKCADGDELTGSLTFLGPDLQEELGSISFAHVGIISVEPEATDANAESIGRFTAELYCEEMFIDAYTK